MSNVIPFVKPKAEYVIIEDGVIEQSNIPSEVGHHMYFVSVVDSEGELCVWNGPSRDLAMRQAIEVSQDWDGIEILDRTDRGTLQ